MSKKKATGTIASNPVITTISGGVRVGNVFVDIPDVGRAKVFYDDPQSLDMFSFQKGDNVKIEWWKKGEWLNANILTPSGSVDYPEDALESALNKINGGSVSNEEGATVLDDMAAIIVLSRQAVLDAGILDTIDADTSDDATEETIRTASMGLFIEVNRKGISYDDLLG